MAQQISAALFNPREQQASNNQDKQRILVTGDQKTVDLNSDEYLSKIPTHTYQIDQLKKINGYLNQVDEATNYYLGQQAHQSSEYTKPEVFKKSFTNDLSHFGLGDLYETDEEEEDQETDQYQGPKTVRGFNLMDDDPYGTLDSDSSYLMDPDMNIVYPTEPVTFPESTSPDPESKPSYQELLELFNNNNFQKAVQKVQAPRPSTSDPRDPLRLVASTNSACDGNPCEHGVCTASLNNYDCACYEGFIKTKGDTPKCVGCAKEDTSFGNILVALGNANMRLAKPADMQTLYNKIPEDKKRGLTSSDWENFGCDDDTLHYGKKSKCRIMCKSRTQRLSKLNDSANKVKHIVCECNKIEGTCTWVHNTEDVGCFSKENAEKFDIDEDKIAAKTVRKNDRNLAKAAKQLVRDERQEAIQLRKSEKSTRKTQVINERSSLDKALFINMRDFGFYSPIYTPRWERYVRESVVATAVDMMVVSGVPSIVDKTFEYLDLILVTMNAEEVAWKYEVTPCTGPTLEECRLTAFFYKEASWVLDKTMPETEEDDGSFLYKPTCGVFKRTEGYAQKVTLCAYIPAADADDPSNTATETEIKTKVVPELVDIKENSTNNTLIFGNFKFDCPITRKQDRVNGFDTTKSDEIRTSIQNEIDFEGFDGHEWWLMSRKTKCAGFGLMKLKHRKTNYIGKNCVNAPSTFSGLRMWAMGFGAEANPLLCSFL